MRVAILKSVLVLSMAGLPTLASTDVGSITLDIKSSGQDSLTFPAGSIPASIPIEVYFSATTGGLDGANNGVAAIMTDITGSAIAAVTQSALTPDATFTSAYLPAYGVYGLGFDQFGMAGGAGGVGMIEQVGDAQSASPGPGAMDMPGAGTAGAPHANGLPPVLLATGTLNLVSLSVGQSVSVETAGAGNLWELGGLTQPASIVDDSLSIFVMAPEPTTALLFTLGACMLNRRRRR
jgi:hypothetical protein